MISLVSSLRNFPVRVLRSRLTSSPQMRRISPELVGTMTWPGMILSLGFAGGVAAGTGSAAESEVAASAMKVKIGRMVFIKENAPRQLFRRLRDGDFDRVA